jgi:hypothetical protein
VLAIYPYLHSFSLQKYIKIKVELVLLHKYSDLFEKTGTELSDSLIIINLQPDKKGLDAIGSISIKNGDNRDGGIPIPPKMGESEMQQKFSCYLSCSKLKNIK